MVSPLVAMNCEVLSTTNTSPLITTNTISLPAELVMPLLALLAILMMEVR